MTMTTLMYYAVRVVPFLLLALAAYVACNHGSTKSWFAEHAGNHAARGEETKKMSPSERMVVRARLRRIRARRV